MSAPSKETRRHKRFSVDVEAVAHTASNQRIAARTRDLSRSGICLITSSALQGNESVVIELVLAFGNNAFSEPLRLDARVVWCTSIGQSFQVGAMFDHLTRDHGEFLEMFLRYLDGSLGPSGEKEDDDDKEQEPPPDVKDDPFRD